MMTYKKENDVRALTLAALAGTTMALGEHATPDTIAARAIAIALSAGAQLSAFFPNPDDATAPTQPAQQEPAPVAPAVAPAAAPVAAPPAV